MSTRTDLHHRATVIDIHAHPALKMALFRYNLMRRFRALPTFFFPFTLRTSIPALEKGGVDVLFSAVYAPEKRLLDDMSYLKLLRYIPLSFMQRAWNELIKPPYYEVTTHILDDLERQLSTPRTGRRAVIVRSVRELDDILNQGDQAPIAFVHTLEGAHALEGTSGHDDEILRHLQAYYDRGVALLTLAHFYPNRSVMPVFPYPQYALPLLRRRRIDKLWTDLNLTEGLTRTGERVVEKMIELGMLIDVSHCTPIARQRIYDIVAASSRRSLVVATHVGAYQFNPSPYNLEDWEIRWIADHGGLVGVIFMNYWLMPYAVGLGLNALSATIEQFVKAAGGRTEHVALGTDFDGFTDPPDDLKDASELSRLTVRLLSELQAGGRRKYSDGDVENILGKNALRVLREGWGKKM